MKTRCLFPLLSVLALAALLAPPASADIGGGPDRLLQPLDYPIDSDAIFRLAAQGVPPYGCQVGDTVDVTFSIEFTEPGELVQSFSNRIVWPAGDLTLLSIEPVEDSPCDVLTQDIQADHATWTCGVDTVLIAQPLLVLRFLTGCGGYGLADSVNFQDPNQNTFVCDEGGFWVTKSAGEYIGTAILLQESNDWMRGWWRPGYPGGPDVAVPIMLSNSVPGTVSLMEITFDEGLVAVDSVTSLVGDATLQWDTDTPGLLRITSSFVHETGDDDILNVYWRLLTWDVDYEIMFNFGPGTVFDSECGEEPSWWFAWFAGGIQVPDYATTAGLADVSYPTTATQYDVCFNLSSTMPVDSLQYWIQYPADQLTFMGPVGVPGYVVPWAGADAGVIQLCTLPGSPTPAYPLLESPTCVFKLRFVPKQAFPADTVFPLSFIYPGSSWALYGAPPLVAVQTLQGGSITLYTPGHTTCPALSIWDGTGYRLENNLLAACDGVHREQDVTDHYLISGPLKAQDGELRLRISEEDDDVTTFRQLTLLAVDHQAARPIQVDHQGHIVELRQPLALQWARDNTGRDVTELLAAPDQIAFTSDQPGWLEVGYGTLLASQVPTGRVASIAPPPPKETPLTKSATPVPQKLRVLAMQPGGWQLIEEVDARVLPQAAPAMIPPEVFAAGREIILRYEWTGSYQMDFAELVMTAPFEGPIVTADLVRAAHSTAGDIRSRLGREPVVLAPGQAIDLAFTAGKEPPEADPGLVRDYILVVSGRYQSGQAEPAAPAPQVFGLGGASPNPFNPTTEIAYSLDRTGPVSLLVYDARGALVRTLVSGTQDAGSYRVTWDGRDDGGRLVASGTYFCRLASGPRQELTKLLLLK
jgi:hypothetical protein